MPSGRGTADVIEMARRAESMMDWIGAIFLVKEVEGSWIWIRWN